MKFLKTIILLIFLISIFPFGALCYETHQDTEAEHTEHDHCILMCHSICTHAIVLNQKVVSIPTNHVISSVLPLNAFFYKSPFLDTLIRPPVVSA